MKVLVTGSEGFLGSHLTEKLIDLNYEVTAIIQYNSYNDYGWLSSLVKKNSKKLKVFFGDVRDESFLDNHFKDVKIVYHLAALISIPHSYNSYSSYVDTNIVGTKNVLTLSKKYKLKKSL